MTGCELLSTDGTTPSAVGEALGDGLQVTDTGLRDSDRTYYDTFDGLLRGAGLSVAHEDGELHPFRSFFRWRGFSVGTIYGCNSCDAALPSRRRCHPAKGNNGSHAESTEN